MAPSSLSMVGVQTAVTVGDHRVSSVKASSIARNVYSKGRVAPGFWRVESVGVTVTVLAPSAGTIAQAASSGVGSGRSKRSSSVPLSRARVAPSRAEKLPVSKSTGVEPSGMVALAAEARKRRRPSTLPPVAR